MRGNVVWGERDPETMAMEKRMSAARSISKHAAIALPGLLQTEEYARALLADVGFEADKIEKVVSSRIERQEILDRARRVLIEAADGKALRVIVGIAAGS